MLEPIVFETVGSALRRVLRKAGERLAAFRRNARRWEWEAEVGVALARLYERLDTAGTSSDAAAATLLDEAVRLTGSSWGLVVSADRASENPVVIETRGLENLKEGCGAPPDLLSSAGAASACGVRQTSAASRTLAVPILAGGRPVAEIVVGGTSADYASEHREALGRLAGLYGLALERRAVRERTRAALREKELLLREVHHRVKNNLQVISSLLSLQAARVADETAARILTESQGRVKAMAMVHEQLHRSSNMDAVDFGDYVHRLAASLFSSYGVDSSRISLAVAAPEARLDIELAVPCGLIVHELISNALQHAFPDGRQGEIRVSLARSETDRGEMSGKTWILTVRDNGVGMPRGLEPGRTASLGLRLVTIFAEQLGARLHITHEGGAEFRLEFREPVNTNQGDNDAQTENSGR